MSSINAAKRIAKEMEQFNDPSLKDTIIRVRHMDYNSVSVEMPDGSTWRVTRDDDFLKPPTLLRHSIFIKTCDAEFSPAFTSLRWLLMVYFQAAY